MAPFERMYHSPPNDQGSGDAEGIESSEKLKIPLKRIDYGKSVFESTGDLRMHGGGYGLYGMDSTPAQVEFAQQLRNYGFMFGHLDGGTCVPISSLEAPVSRKYTVVDPKYNLADVTFLAFPKIKADNGRYSRATRNYITEMKHVPGDVFYSLVTDETMSFSTNVYSDESLSKISRTIGGEKVETIKTAERVGDAFSPEHPGFARVAGFLANSSQRACDIGKEDFENKDDFFRAVAQYLDAHTLQVPLVVAEIKESEYEEVVGNFHSRDDMLFKEDKRGAQYLLWVE